MNASDIINALCAIALFSGTSISVAAESPVFDLRTSLQSIDSQMSMDDDGDGYSLSDGDCDDSDPLTYPGATEAIDSLDNDCDGYVDNP